VRPALRLDRLREGESTMKYGIAFLLGVPASVLVVWYLISHLL
jgi:hypothetical protein